MRIDLAVAASTVLGQNLEILINWVAPILIRMVVRAMLLSTVEALLAGVQLEVPWMILLLFPAVAELAAVLVLAAIRV